MKVRNGPGRCHKLRGLFIGEQPVPVVHVPVELLLKRDHPTANALIVLTSGGGGELLRQIVEFTPRLHR